MKYRSEEMTHKKIRIPKESAIEVLSALGKIKNGIEFEDLTKNDLEAKKSYSDTIKRIDEMRKRISEYHQTCKDFNIPFKTFDSFEEFNSFLEKDIKERDKKFGSTYFDLIENEIFENGRRISELVDSHAQIRDDLVTLIEKKHVLLKGSELIRTAGTFVDAKNVSSNEEDMIKTNTLSNLVVLAGTIPVENELKMKRMIFRISRGNAITAFYDLEISKDEYLLTSTVRKRGFSYANKKKNVLIEKDENILASFVHNENRSVNTKKKIFSIFFAGGEENVLLQKILRVCEIFQASRFPIPQNTKIQEELENLTKDISVKRNIIITIEKNINDLVIQKNNLEGKRGCRYSLYRLYFEQQRSIYKTLSKCVFRENFIDGQVWIPKKKLGEVVYILNNMFEGQENKLSAHLEDIEFDEEIKPPTLIVTNDFTYVPQLIVDTYGIPRYQEINPGYFCAITFPFLFGVMFGDIGHSIFLLSFAIYLMYNNKKFSANKKSIFCTLAKTRYFLLLMGVFSLFCGLLYNDFLSVPIYFKSCYEREGDAGSPLKRIENCNYSFGLDPAWYITTNELMFVNSLKMKFSVIFGVFQMTLGIIMKGLNALFERDFVEYLCVYIPQLIFMTVLFGYMNFLIFLKWSINYKGREFRAPDIKSFLMDIFLKFGKIPDPPEEGKDWILIGERGFSEKVHFGILVVSVVSLIIMFVPKIFLNYNIEKKKRKAKRLMKVNKSLEDLNEQLLEKDNNNAQNEIQDPLLSDFIVASVIETIEFALGSVSNTASYLRLWALSLAHSQLSAVFFKYSVGMMSMMTKLFFIDGFLLAYVYLIFAAVSFGVLLCMDLMECFLHTLRLHWVEFQNKFFQADGYKFEPFCFELNIELSDDEIN